MSSFFWLQCIWHLVIYWVNFFFNFIPSKLIFLSDLVIILLIIVYLVLNYFSGYFFQIHPFALGILDLILIFLIVVYLDWILYWIDLSLNFIPWHFIFISNMVLILWIAIFSCSYPFLNCFFFQFHPLWFYFILFLCQI
jgi:hypothetical protein